MKTQKETVLKMLSENEWVSTVDFVSNYILRGSERIRELIADGYTVQSRRRSGKPYQEYKMIQNQG